MLVPACGSKRQTRRTGSLVALGGNKRFLSEPERGTAKYPYFVLFKLGRAYKTILMGLSTRETSSPTRSFSNEKKKNDGDTADVVVVCFQRRKGLHAAEFRAGNSSLGICKTDGIHQWVTNK